MEATYPPANRNSSRVRVFLEHHCMVILDEASSRLDPITERRRERAMDRLLMGRTCIVIAHRLSTVQRADDIMVLDGGKIVDSASGNGSQAMKTTATMNCSNPEVPISCHDNRTV